MLLLSRREGQVIHIGEFIRVIVNKIENGTVQIGIEAPRDIPVHRSEVLERIRRDAELDRVLS